MTHHFEIEYLNLKIIIHINYLSSAVLLCALNIIINITFENMNLASNTSRFKACNIYNFFLNHFRRVLIKKNYNLYCAQMFCLLYIFKNI